MGHLTELFSVINLLQLILEAKKEGCRNWKAKHWTVRRGLFHSVLFLTFFDKYLVCQIPTYTIEGTSPWSFIEQVFLKIYLLLKNQRFLGINASVIATKNESMKYFSTSVCHSCVSTFIALQNLMDKFTSDEWKMEWGTKKRSISWASNHQPTHLKNSAGRKNSN